MTLFYYPTWFFNILIVTSPRIGWSNFHLFQEGEWMGSHTLVDRLTHNVHIRKKIISPLTLVGSNGTMYDLYTISTGLTKSWKYAFNLWEFGTSLSTLLISWIRYFHTICDIDDQKANYVYILRAFVLCILTHGIKSSNYWTDL